MEQHLSSFDHNFDNNSDNDSIPNSQHFNHTYQYEELQDLLEYYKEKICKHNFFPKNDLKVIHDLLIETINYINLLASSNQHFEKRNSLYELTKKIIDHLETLYSQDSITYPTKMKIKLYEAQFLYYVKYNYSNAEEILQKIISLQEIIGVSMLNQATSYFFAALLQFQLNNISLAKIYAKKSLDIFESKMYVNSNDDFIDPNGNVVQRHEENVLFRKKKVKKLSYVLDLLNDIYLLQNDKNSARSCIENAYYLNIGCNGRNDQTTINYAKQINRPREIETDQTIKDNKNHYQDYSLSDDKVEHSQNSLLNHKMIKLLKGTVDNFSFKIPISELSEPFLISLYKTPLNFYQKQPRECEEIDMYAPSLFLTNLYIDKGNLFKYFCIDSFSKDNNLLYTDNNINAILEKIYFDNNGLYGIKDPRLKRIILN